MVLGKYVLVSVYSVELIYQVNVHVAGQAIYSNGSFKKIEVNLGNLHYNVELDVAGVVNLSKVDNIVVQSCQPISQDSLTSH